MWLTKILNSLQALKSPHTKLALIVRADLKMSKGKTAAQTAHAAVLCYAASQENKEKQSLIQAWYATGQPKIVLRVDNYEEFANIQKMATEAGVLTALVKDAGRTQLAPGTATVLGVGPDAVEAVDKLVAHLKLL